MTITRRFIARVLTVGVVLAVVAGGSAWGANPFTDINGAGAHRDNIDAIYNAGITAGCAADNFCPNTAVNRAQMASFLARGLGISAGSIKNFPKANARSQSQAYCAMAAASPRSFRAAPCAANLRVLSTTTATSASIAIGIDGLPLIAYYDSGTNDLLVARCQDSLCLVSTSVAIDSDGDVGQYVSLTIDNTGAPMMAYYDATNTNLKYALCQDPKCGSAHRVVLDDSELDVGKFPSITTGPERGAVISYFNDTDNAYKVAKCFDAQCFETPTRHTIDSDAPGGGVSSIAVGADGFPVISYHTVTEDGSQLSVAHCSNATCLDHSVVTLDDSGNAGAASAVAIGTDDLPVIAYRDDANDLLKVAHCSDGACVGATITSFEAGTGVAPAITIGTHGNPVIVASTRREQFDEVIYQPHVIRCRDRACTQSTAAPLALITRPVPNVSVAMGTDGQAIATARAAGLLTVGRAPVS